MRAPSPMKVVAGIDALDPTLGRLFFAVGVFDGLHRGHTYLLNELGRAARDRHARPAVVTFDHHPDEILTGAAPPLLCDPDERLDRLASAGVEVTVVQHFDVALRTTPYDVFVRRILGHVQLAGFLMTPDAAFGFERRGTPVAVGTLGRELGYEVEVVPPLTLDGRPVSSAAIRAAIAAGNLADAERLLGHPYSVVGSVTSSRDGQAALAFALPVALPPDGKYPVTVEALDGGATPDARAANDATTWLDAPSATVSVAVISAAGRGFSVKGVSVHARRYRVTFQ